MATSGPGREGVFRVPGYLPFWLAETVSEFGNHITTIALQVLVVLTLYGTATDVGLLNAFRWLPYLVLGLIVGALVDRRRRKPLMITTDVGRGVLLVGIPVLWLLGWLNLPVLMAFVVLFGVLSLVNDSASQSFLPRLVPQSSLLSANARLDQSAAVAQTSGPLVAGAVVALLGAPIAVLVDAVSYLFSAAAIARIRITESIVMSERRNLRREIVDGLQWVYRHQSLAPFAIATHGWFLFNSVVITVFVPFALLEFDLSPFELGITLASQGAAAIVGTVLAAPVGRRAGVGPVVIACHGLTALAWAVVALSPWSSGAVWLTIAVIALGQGIYGLALGLSNANEMSYRQAVTPDALQGRMNTTMRSVNRAMIVVGAPVGGLLADSLGYRPTIWIAVAGFVLVALFLAVSPFRQARH